MAKLNYTPLAGSNLIALLATINNNFEAVSDALDLAVFRNGADPNHMLADVDMNSQRLINLPAPLSATEPVRLGDIADDVEATIALTLPHFTDNNDETAVTIGSLTFRTYGNFQVTEANESGPSDVSTVAFNSVIAATPGQQGGITAGQFLSVFADVPTAWTGGSPALRGWIIHPQGVDLSAFTQGVMEGVAGIVSSSGDFAGLMGGVWGVCEANGDSTPTQKHRFIALDHGAVTDTTQASTAYDAMYTATSAGGVGPKTVFQISDCFGAMPAKADGSTIVFGFEGSATWSVGFDLTGQTFTNGAVLLPNGTSGKVRGLNADVSNILDIAYVNAANQVVIGDPASVGNLFLGGTNLFGNVFGYAAGFTLGGTVTQLTSKSTAVTLDKLSGQITMNNASLGAGGIVSFTLNSIFIGATDLLVLNHVSGGTLGAYTLNAACAAGSATITVRNNTAGALGEALVIRFAIIRGAIT